jgi:2-polyprenyl-3-methyl-5-hydroxy-6-metoxy-1,4-benzoquinol methylase
MQGQNQIEKFAGQRILAMDPRTEKPLRACPACSANEAVNLGIKNELEIVRCCICKSIYCSYTPWYTSERYYIDYYSHHGLDLPPVVAKRLREITAGFSQYRKTNRLLDLGCGAGSLLEAARAHGWDAQGIDVSISSVNHVRELGFEVFHGELTQAQLMSEQFDVIAAVEILEHLFDPVKVVKEAYRLLRPGGLLWLTTPHGRGLPARVLGLDWRVVSPPEHLQLFSVTGLKTLLERAGFRQINTRTTGGNPFELWRGIRERNSPVQTAQGNFNAVASNYRLNEAMTKSRTRQTLKNALNGLLNLTHLGDSLTACAIR